MPAYSGTVSSSQGVRTIDVTPNDVVTFTPSSATYTVEYPIGTLAISASTSAATVTANASATQMRILCVSGSVAYANVDNNDGTPLTPTESQSVRALVSGGGISPDGLSNVMTRGLYGSIQAAAASGSTFTYHSTITLEQGATRFRIWLPNVGSTSSTVALTKIAVSDTLGADPTVAGSGEVRYTPSTATWVTVTFGGSNSVTLPPAFSTTANTREPSWTPSDWIDLATVARIDGGTLPVFMVRSLVNSGQDYNTGQYPISEWQKAVSTINNGRVWTGYRYTGDGVTTPANFVYTTNLGASIGPFHMRVEYAGQRPGITIAISGDSIADGAVNGSVGNYGNGWSWQLVSLLRAARPTLPIEILPVSFSGTNSASFLARLQRFVASGVHYDAVIHSPCSPNDGTPTQAVIDAQARIWAQCSELIGRGSFVSLPTVVPTLAASPAAYIAPANGMVAIAGGTVSAVTLTRPGSTAVTAPTAGLVPVLAGDIVTVTYTVAPTTTFVPNGTAAVPGKPFIISTPCPNTSLGWNAAADAFRLALKATILASRNSGTPVIDFDAALSDGATPARLVAAYTTDNLHPNEAGHAVMASVASPVMLPLLPLVNTAI
jgi:lysophospholipase L1-like esterase